MMPPLAETLRECAVLERQLAGIYEHFAGAWAEDAEASALWADLAREEYVHAKDFASVLRQHFGIPSPAHPAEDPDPAGAFRARILGPLTLDGALEATLDLELLEADLTRRKLRELSEDAPGATGRAVRTLLEMLSVHERLLSAVDRLGTSPALREKAEALRSAWACG